VEGDSAMFNQYGIIDINPEHCPNVKTDLAGQFIDWILSSDGQTAIADYKRDGQQLFFPNAN
ncbi:MAG: sulfate transporter, partial [Hyphomicrobiales bacterium]